MQSEVLFKLTVLFEPVPLPEIIIPDPDGVGDGETEGLAEGEPEGLEEGEEDGELVGLDEGFTDGLGLEDGETEGEGVGKFAAAVKLLPILLAVSENSPKTDWLKIAKDKKVKTEKRKNVFLIILSSSRICHSSESWNPVNTSWILDLVQNDNSNNFSI